MKRAGVLALQGDFEAHAKALTAAGAEPVLVREAADLEHLDGLILPGGESTTMLKLLHGQSLFDPIRAFSQSRPVFGTCAGAILMAREVSHPQQESFGMMDIGVERNGYGRQIDSRVTRLPAKPAFQERMGAEDLEGVFIRAPILRRVGSDVTVLAEYEGEPVLVEQGSHLAATFHPELTGDLRVHRYFLSKL